MGVLQCATFMQPVSAIDRNFQEAHLKYGNQRIRLSDLRSFINDAELKRLLLKPRLSAAYTRAGHHLRALQDVLHCLGLSFLSFLELVGLRRPLHGSRCFPQSCCMHTCSALEVDQCSKLGIQSQLGRSMRQRRAAQGISL